MNRLISLSDDFGRIQDRIDEMCTGHVVVGLCQVRAKRFVLFVDAVTLRTCQMRLIEDDRSAARVALPAGFGGQRLGIFGRQAILECLSGERRAGGRNKERYKSHPRGFLEHFW